MHNFCKSKPTIERGVLMKKTRHEGDEGTVSFWLWMKALYKDEE